MFELIYTSSPQGLLPGRAGFCTVAMTGGMPPNLLLVLENLSGYNFVQHNGAFPSEFNPVCCYYIKMRYGMQLLHTVGRIAPNGLDYSQRNNKIAHHILLESPEELAQYPTGAAELFTLDGVFCQDFQGEPHQLPGRRLPAGNNQIMLPAVTWQKIMHDAGFAALIAEKFRQDPAKPFYIKYTPQISCQELLQLIREVCALLTPAERQNFTFSTYFSSSNAASECFLRMLPDFSPLLDNLRRLHANNLLELDVPTALPESCSGELYELSRHGQTASIPTPPPASKIRLKQPENSSQESIYVPPSSPVKAHKQAPQPERLQRVQSSRRQLIFIGIAGIILLAAMLGMLYKFSGNSSGTAPQLPTPPSERPLPAADTLIKAPPASPAVPVPANKAALPEKPAEQVPCPAPQAAATAVQTTDNFADPTVQTAQTLDLPVQESFNLFVQFLQLTACNTPGNYWELELPELLKNTEKIEAKISKIGSMRIPSSEFIQRITPLRLVVLSLKKGLFSPTAQGRYPEGPLLQLDYENTNNKLIMQHIGSSKHCIMPEINNLESLSFELKNRRYIWRYKFIPGYLQLIATGQITIDEHGNTDYRPGKLEDLFNKYAAVQIGSCSTATFRSSKFEFEQWNNSVEEHQQKLMQIKLKQKYISQIAPRSSTLPDEDSCRTQMAAILNQAKSRDFTPGNFQAVKNAADDFIAQFFTSQMLQRNSATADVIKNFPDKLEDRWEDQLEKAELESNEKEQQEDMIEKYCETLEARIVSIGELQKLKNELQLLQRQLKDIHKKLKQHGGQITSTGKKISISIHDFARNMLSNDPNYWINPKKITVIQINELANQIQQAIRLAPLPGAAQEF
ncbi:MAG: hypothetical protein E7052_07425 [Lentisphaerae bacterium]|nr:hypothetical protein [Lentisphaerota bacterium]